jgi:antitoxin component of MazEF toxin-antitoxin module
MRLVRQITTIGNSVGVTLPRELLDRLGLSKGSFVEVRAMGKGLLLRPLRLPSEQIRRASGARRA